MPWLRWQREPREAGESAGLISETLRMLAPWVQTTWADGSPCALEVRPCGRPPCPLLLACFQPLLGGPRSIPLTPSATLGLRFLRHCLPRAQNSPQSWRRPHTHARHTCSQGSWGLSPTRRHVPRLCTMVLVRPSLPCSGAGGLALSPSSFSGLCCTLIYGVGSVKGLGATEPAWEFVVVLLTCCVTLVK